VARRLCTITSFYRYAEEEGLLAHSPAVHVRRPRIDSLPRCARTPEPSIGAPRSQAASPSDRAQMVPLGAGCQRFFPRDADRGPALGGQCWARRGCWPGVHFVGAARQ
jgi:hypothetical protein